MADTLFPSIIPSQDTYSAMDLVNQLDAWILQGIAAAHTSEKINGQSSAVEIAAYITGNHNADEIDGMVEIVENSEPPRSEIDLGPALNSDGNLGMYQ